MAQPSLIKPIPIPSISITSPAAKPEREGQGAGQNTFLITHKPNIIDALGKDWFDVKEGEASIFKPEDGKYRLVARVQMEDWPKFVTVKERYTHSRSRQERTEPDHRKALGLTIPEIPVGRRRGDRIAEPFAAMRMSAFGTKRTSRDVCYLSGFSMVRKAS